MTAEALRVIVEVLDAVRGPAITGAILNEWVEYYENELTCALFREQGCPF